METFDAVQKRCSLKDKLSGKAIEPEIVDMVLEAARLAPSARNSQPWRFIVVQEREAVAELVETAFFGPCQIVKQAPVVVVVCAKPGDDMSYDGKEYYLFDVGLAVQNMLLAATDLGLVTHLLISYDEAAVKRVLHIPDDVRVVVATPLAYPPGDSYDEAAAERLSRRSRKDLSEVICFNKWGEKVEIHQQ